jgi:hypothetical protein
MRLLRFSAELAGLLALAFPTGSDSCGIAPPVPVFATAHRPADIGEFAKGKIGVIRPSYQRRYLIGAYRMLSGKPLSVMDAQALYAGQKPSQPSFSDIRWPDVRKKMGAGGPPFVGTYRNKSDGGSFVSYPNCLEDAFESAVKTFQQRAAQWGPNDPRLREWFAAQDKVFANCSGKDAVIPDAPAPGMDPLLVSDRRYQIAASYFYAAEWQKARDAFAQVWQDQGSPWRTMAPYLIARTYIREATVDEKPEALQQAAERLQAIVDDPAQQAWREPSRKLLEYLRLRADPTLRLTELGDELTGTRPVADLAQSATDFLYLYGRAPDAPATSDLADWLATFEGHAGDQAHALAQWNKRRSPAWLIAALVYGHDAEAIRAARGTDPNAPEYEAVSYYGILADSNQEEARAWADEVLKRNLLLSTRNLILEQRLRYARNWAEFLRYAPRSPEPKLQSFDGSEEDIDKPPVSSGTAALLDFDSADAFNHNVPLSLWTDAANNPELPPNLQLQAAEAAWVRVLVLGSDAEARKLMQRIVQLDPSFAAPAGDVLAASDASAARFAGVFLLLRTPELQSSILAGQAAGDLNKVSHLGVISWGFAAGCESQEHHGAPAPPAFLSPAQRDENTEEWNRMAAAAPSGGAYLAAQTLAWAGTHPDDPRVPEALHLVVQAGRRACRDLQKPPVAYGRTAFELLHNRYPKSEWTEKTRYWYQ